MTTTTETTSHTVTTTTTSSTETTTTATETSTSTSTATSTTLTTTAFCMEDGIAWEPLDMQGTFPMKVKSPEACHRKCLKKSGCYHFTYWRNEGTCHLQDALALRRVDRVNFVSGPFQCWGYIKHTGLVKVDDGVYLPRQLKCMEVGVSWDPPLEIHPIDAWQGTEMDKISACQKLCMASFDCAHFTVEVTSATCKLSGKDAIAVKGIFNTISGPVVDSCPGRSRGFMRKFEASEGFHWPYMLAVAFICTVLVASVVSAAVVALRCRRAAGRDQGYRTVLLAYWNTQDEDAPLD